MTLETGAWAAPGTSTPAAPPPDVSAEPESLVVTLDTGDRAHFLDWGPPRDGDRLPPLLLVHGLGHTAWSWAPIARRLCGVTRVVAPDLRGHGLSDAPRSGYDLESLAFDLLTVLAAVGAGDEVGGPPAVVAGHGLGAIVASATAALRPASFAGLALVDGGWEDLHEITGEGPGAFVRGLADPPEVLSSMASYLADRREYDPASWDSDQERAARAAVDEKHAGHVAPVMRPHVLQRTVDALFEHRPSEVLARVPMPLLITLAHAGTGDDETARERELALEDVMRARRRAGLGEARVVRFAGAGHNLMRYRPDALAAELAGLLEVGAADSRG